MESPKTAQNACYFYNRIDEKGIRWISYHFETDADVPLPLDEKVLNALSLLQTKADNTH